MLKTRTENTASVVAFRDQLIYARAYSVTCGYQNVFCVTRQAPNAFTLHLYDAHNRICCVHSKLTIGGIMSMVSDLLSYGQIHQSM